MVVVAEALALVEVAIADMTEVDIGILKMETETKNVAVAEEGARSNPDLICLRLATCGLETLLTI